MSAAALSNNDGSTIRHAQILALNEKENSEQDAAPDLASTNPFSPIPAKEKEPDPDTDSGDSSSSGDSSGSGDGDGSSDESSTDSDTASENTSNSGSSDGSDGSGDNTSSGDQNNSGDSGSDTGAGDTTDNTGSNDNGDSGSDDSGSDTNLAAANPDNQEPAQTQFSSHTTNGFNGEVLDDTIRVTWEVDPDARGYNVYRQAQYITSVFSNEYIDEDVYDRDYYYEIQAFNHSDELYYVATGLTVKARSFGRTDPDAPVVDMSFLDEYELIFSDEFNGTELDKTKWNTRYLWGTELVINSEEQYYVDINNKPDFGFNPFTFDGEHLTINSIRTPEEYKSKSLNQPYLSGVITSYDAFKFTYGYAEARAKVTFGRGYWPAFWLLNAYYVDDKPEIDIMEFIGDDQDVIYHTYHYYDSQGNLRSTKSKPTPGIDFTSDFHTYAVDWRPNTLVFYVDGVEVHRITDPKVSRQEMYIIANTALGGWWAGSPDDNTPFPGEYILDYIRVYQKRTPYNDDVLLNDGITDVPLADDIFGQASPSHRPPFELWPEGYPDGL